jgi:hypothetical protein
MIKCHWISSNSDIANISKDRTASVRLRLGAALHSKDLHITTGMVIPKNIDVVVWPKFSWLDARSSIQLENNINVANALKKTGIIQIVDYTDHHLDKTIPSSDGRSDKLNDSFLKKSIENRKYYFELLSIVDFITSPTKYIADALKTEGILKPVWVVQDAIDPAPNPFPEKEKNNQNRALWYGAHFSFQQLVNNIKKLDDSLNEPLILECLVGKATLNDAKNGHYKFPDRKKLKIIINEWSLEKMIPAAIKSDVIFLPSSITDSKRKLASPNRLISAFSFSRPVIATRIPSYSDFSSYFIDFDSLELNEKIQNINELMNKSLIQNAKEISLKFEPAEIANEWSTAFKEMTS